MKEIFKSMLQDERGSVSHKRIVVTIGAVCLFIALFLGVKINEHVADLIATIVAVGMGFTTWDKFSNKNKKDE
jgi:Na+/H+ antiporter NhaC